MLKEFKEFAIKGNVMDMAIGVIIGAAFSKVVSSLVSDVFMPPIGQLLGKLDFSNLFINLTATPYASLADAKKAGAATINYGLFINTVIDFTIVSFVIFLVIKQINRFKKQPVAAAPNSKECPYCLSSIALKASRCAHCTATLTN